MENNFLNLEVSKQFQCSKETLYKAWTDPEQLKQWWKPMGKRLTEVENNITEGGEVRYTFENNSPKIDGKYVKVDDHNVLEYTWNWHLSTEQTEDSAYKLSVRFEGDENKSSIFIAQYGFKNQESVQPHKHGWEQGLKQLHEYLSGSSNNQQSLQGQQKPPITGYNETPEQLKVAGG